MSGPIPFKPASGSSAPQPTQFTTVRLTDGETFYDATGGGGGGGVGLTNTELRATPVPVSGTITASGPLTDAQLRATPVPISGPLTDAQLRATPVPVSGTVTASGVLTDAELRATAVPVSGPLTDTQLRATAVPVSGTVTASGPLTDSQLRATAVPVSGTVAVSGGTVSAATAAGVLLLSWDGSTSGSTSGAPTTVSGTDTGIIDISKYRTILMAAAAHTSSSPGTAVLQIMTLPWFDSAANGGSVNLILKSYNNGLVSGNTYRASTLMSSDVQAIATQNAIMYCIHRTPYLRTYLEWTSSSAGSHMDSVSFRVWGFY